MTNRQVAERWVQAIRDQDVGTQGELMHPDIIVTYPQSGEVIRGKDNYRALLSSYPSGLPAAEVAEPKGTEESVYVASPLPFGMPTITVSGGGDTFVVEGVATYPDGGVFNVASIIQLREGLVAEETTYFAAPFDPPDWRKPFVER